LFVLRPPGHHRNKKAVYFRATFFGQFAVDAMDDASQTANAGSSKRLSLRQKVTAGIFGLAGLLGALGVIYGDLSAGLTKAEEAYARLHHILFPQIQSEWCQYTAGPLAGTLGPALVPARTQPQYPPENSPCSDPKTGSTGIYKAQYAK
jgi:hypothetical protein